MTSSMSEALREHVRRTVALVALLVVLLLIVASSSIYGAVRSLIDRAGVSVEQQPAS
jgi:hypothetical protein